MVRKSWHLDGRRLCRGRLDRPLGFQKFLNAFHRIAFLGEKAVNAPREGNVVRPIIAAVSGTLQRLQLGELRLPIAQYMLRHAQFGGKFADRSESVRGLFAGRHCRAYLAIRSRMI